MNDERATVASGDPAALLASLRTIAKSTPSRAAAGAPNRSAEAVRPSAGGIPGTTGVPENAAPRISGADKIS
jgi:hypothetical protein